VIVDKLHVAFVAVREARADPPLVVNANAELSGAVALQGFESVLRWDPQFIDRHDAIQYRKVSHRHFLDVREAGDPRAAELRFGVLAAKRFDCIVLYYRNTVVL